MTSAEFITKWKDNKLSERAGAQAHFLALCERPNAAGWCALRRSGFDHAHRQAGDRRTVARAYGWDDYTPEMPDEEIRRRLLKLNRERATQ